MTVGFYQRQDWASFPALAENIIEAIEGLASIELMFADGE